MGDKPKTTKTSWNCGECGQPVSLFQGTKKGGIYYNCPCGAHVRVEKGKPSHGNIAQAFAEQVIAP